MPESQERDEIAEGVEFADPYAEIIGWNDNSQFDEINSQSTTTGSQQEVFTESEPEFGPLLDPIYGHLTVLPQPDRETTPSPSSSQFVDGAVTSSTESWGLVSTLLDGLVHQMPIPSVTTPSSDSSSISLDDHGACSQQSKASVALTPLATPSVGLPRLNRNMTTSSISRGNTVSTLKAPPRANLLLKRALYRAASFHGFSSKHTHTDHGTPPSARRRPFAPYPPLARKLSILNSTTETTSVDQSDALRNPHGTITGESSLSGRHVGKT